MLDYFDFYLAPLAIRLGQPAKEFWEGDPDYFWNYLDAYEETEKIKMQYDNAMYHLLGQYVSLAVGQNFSKKEIYPKKPFDLKLEKSHNSRKEINDKWMAYLKSKFKK